MNYEYVATETVIHVLLCSYAGKFHRGLRGTTKHSQGLRTNCRLRAKRQSTIKSTGLTSRLTTWQHPFSCIFAQTANGKHLLSSKPVAAVQVRRCCMVTMSEVSEGGRMTERDGFRLIEDLFSGRSNYEPCIFRTTHSVTATCLSILFPKCLQ